MMLCGIRPSIRCTARTPPASAASAAGRLDRHPAGDHAGVELAAQRRRRQLGDQLAGLDDARHVGEVHQLVGAERARDPRGDDVGVEVVALAVGAEPDRRDHRDVALADQRLEEALVDLDELADLAEVAAVVAQQLPGAQQRGVLARQPDRVRAAAVAGS